MDEAQADMRPTTFRVLEIANQFWNSQFLVIATRLGAADVLESGPQTPEAIAAQLGAHPAMLKRLLRALAPLGVFSADDQGRYGQTPMSDILRAGHPQSLRAAVLFEVDEWTWKYADALEYGIRTGGNPFEHVFGRPYFDYQKDFPEREKLFADAMTGISAPIVEAIAGAYPFNDFDTVVDVGGSNGHLLATILRHHPRPKGVLFDLPGVAQLARKTGYLDAPGVAGRAAIVEGSALEAVVAGHDCYLIKNVIHDWDDDHSVLMLGNIRKAMADGGKLLVAEALIKPDNTPDHWKQMDLAIFAGGGGQQRTEEEFRALLARAGFRLESKTPTAAGIWLLEAVKA